MKQRKRCPACKNELTLDKYNKNKSNPDGLQGECRECCNARARQKTIDRNKAKKLKKKTVKKKVIKQLKKDSTHDLELRGKDLFLGHLANYMADEDADYKVLASRVGYAKSTMSQILAGPHKVSERFIRAVSRKIPALSMEWNKYRHLVHGIDIEDEIDEVIHNSFPVKTGNLYLLIINDEIVDPELSPLTEVGVSEATDTYMQDGNISADECVVEVYKLTKMGFELNTVHDLTIYSPLSDTT